MDPLVPWLALAVALGNNHSGHGVIIAALCFGFSSPSGEVDPRGVFAFDDHSLTHVPQTTDVTAVDRSSLNSAVDTVVDVRSKIVSDETLKS